MFPKHTKFPLFVASLLLLMIWVPQALAGKITLAWNATTTHTDNSAATDLAGYHLYYWQDPGTSKFVPLGKQTTSYTFPDTFTDLVEGQTYSFAVAAYDTAGKESDDSNVVTATIGSNTPPSATANIATTPVNTPVTIAVLNNDSDPDGNTLTITGVTQGAHGTVSYSSNSVTYTPNPNFVGTDVFDYTISDGKATATAHVTVTVTSVNHAPVAVADTVSTSVNTPITIAVLDNDSDPDGNALTITGIVAQGTAYGTVKVSGRNIIYTPNPNFVGIDTFTYTISDGNNGQASAPMKVTVTTFMTLQFEAEAGTLNAPMVVQTTTTAPAVQYVWVPDNNASILDPLLNRGYVQYNFTVPRSDSYVIWGRVSPSATGASSFFIGLDTPPGNGLITNVSPSTYQVATIHVGNQYYMDSSHTITSLPNGFDGLGVIKTAYADRTKNSATFLTFTLWQNATLYVAYDATATSVPTWLTNSFTNTGQNIGTTNGSMRVWQGKKDVTAGSISLPANRYQMSTTVRSQYFVLLAFRGPEPYLVWDATPAQASGTSSGVSNTQPAGLVAAYALDETSGTTAMDASGKGNNGVLTNGPQFVADNSHKGVFLDGRNDYINLGNPASLQMTGSMTLSAWINSSAFPFDDAAIISRLQSPYNGYQLDTTIDRGPRTIGLKISDASGNLVARYGATTMQLNTWYHVAGVYDATSRTMNVYLNGRLDNGALVGTIPGAQPTSTQNVNIGQRPDSPRTYNFAGMLDDVRIYDRALSQAEIQSDMNTPVGSTGVSTAPQPWIWDQAANKTTPIFFLETGRTHTLTIRQRQSGSKLDKLLITNNLTLIPQ